MRTVHSNIYEMNLAHPKGVTAVSTVDYDLLADAMLEANLCHGKDLISDSWSTIKDQTSSDVFSLSKFVDTFFEILFRHITSLESIFDSAHARGELIALILAIVLKDEQGPYKSKEKAQKTLHRLCKSSGIGRPTLLVIGRVLLLTLSTCLPAADFTSTIKQAWIRAYIRGLKGVAPDMDRAPQIKSAEAHLKNTTCTDQEFVALCRRSSGGFSRTDSYITNSNASSTSSVQTVGELRESGLMNTPRADRSKAGSVLMRSLGLPALKDRPLFRRRQSVEAVSKICQSPLAKER